jgi:OPA family sugar phosphate sensor protein UhpC-like MFS transporter
LATQGKPLGKDRNYERWRWQIFFISWLAYLGFYLTRKSFSVAKVELVKPSVMGWSKADLSKIDAAMLITYAIGNFLCGILGDRFGTRKVVLVGMLGSVIAAFLMGASSLILVMGILFAIQGFCQSAGWGPLSKNIGEFFSQRERGSVMGFWCTSYAVGGVLAAALAGYMAEHYGWRYALWGPAAALFVIWVLFLLLQRNRPEDVGLPPIEQYHGEPEALVAPGETPAEEPEGSWAVIVSVLKNKMVMLLAVVYFLVKMPRYFFLFWAPLLINERLGTGTAESGLLGSIYDIASPFGVLLGGYLSDKMFQSRRIPMSIIGLIGTVIILFSFSHLPNTRLALGLGLFGIGFLLNIPDSLVSGTAAIDFGTKKGASTASGLINGVGGIGAVIGETAPGWIDKFVHNGQDSWTYIFMGLGVVMGVAALLLLPKWNELPPVAKERQARAVVSDAAPARVPD